MVLPPTLNLVCPTAIILLHRFKFQGHYIAAGDAPNFRGSVFCRFKGNHTIVQQRCGWHVAAESRVIIC